MPRQVRLPLPSSYIRCVARDCNARTTCARHLTIERDTFDGCCVIQERVCPTATLQHYLPLADPRSA